MNIVEVIDRWTDAAVEAFNLMEERGPQLRPLNELGYLDNKPARKDPFPRLRESPGEPLPQDFALADEIVRYCDSGHCNVGPDPIIEFSDAVRRFYGQRTHFLVAIPQPELTRGRLLILLERALQICMRVQSAIQGKSEGREKLVFKGPLAEMLGINPKKIRKWLDDKGIPKGLVREKNKRDKKVFLVDENLIRQFESFTE